MSTDEQRHPRQPQRSMPDKRPSVPWWPGRTDEVRRVADRLRALDQPDGQTTNGELARRCGCDAWVLADAIAMNAEVADAIAR